MLVVSALVLIAAVGGIWWGLWEQHREIMRMHMQIRMAHALITELLEDERRRRPDGSRGVTPSPTTQAPTQNFTHV